MYLASVRNDTDEAIRIAENLIDENVAGRWGSKAFALGVIANRDLSAGRPDDAIARYLQVYPGLAANQLPIYVPQDSWHYLAASLYSALDLARVYLAAGNTAGAEALLDSVEDELPYWQQGGNWSTAFAEVELYALRGERDKALRALRAVVDEDVWKFWRWRVLHNPNLEVRQGDSEFQAIVEQMETRMARELENLEAMAEGA